MQLIRAEVSSPPSPSGVCTPNGKGVYFKRRKDTDYRLILKTKFKLCALLCEGPVLGGSYSAWEPQHSPSGEARCQCWLQLSKTLSVSSAALRTPGSESSCSSWRAGRDERKAWASGQGHTPLPGRPKTAGGAAEAPPTDVLSGLQQLLTGTKRSPPEPASGETHRPAAAFRGGTHLIPRTFLSPDKPTGRASCPAQAPRGLAGPAGSDSGPLSVHYSQFRRAGQSSFLR